MEGKLVLWLRFHPKLVKEELIPEIEKNCIKYSIVSQTAYEIFEQNKFAENSLYFHHSYVESNIHIGQEYEAIALMNEKWEIKPASIQKCHTKVLCFFTGFRTRPSDYAICGHHALSLIQFEGKIPSIIYELVEVTELKPFMYQTQICLSSEANLRAFAKEAK